MELSIFEVLGPVMIGPSSSHTAGAAKLARIAAIICSKPFYKVTYGLSGSFAKTGTGHGTQKALLAGALGLSEDDERIPLADMLAEKAGIAAEYYEENLEEMHENSVHITFFHTDGTENQVWGSSIGGGRILIRKINHFDTKITAENPTLLIHHIDRPGVVSDVSRILAENGLNIAVMRLTREARGQTATTVIEMDDKIPEIIVEKIQAIEFVMEVIVLNVP